MSERRKNVFNANEIENAQSSCYKGSERSHQMDRKSYVPFQSSCLHSNVEWQWAEFELAQNETTLHAYTV